MKLIKTDIQTLVVYHRCGLHGMSCIGHSLQNCQLSVNFPFPTLSITPSKCVHTLPSSSFRYFEQRLRVSEESYREEIALLQLRLVEGALEESVLKTTDDRYASRSLCKTTYMFYKLG